MKNLQDIFNSYFHGRYHFDDFVSIQAKIDQHFVVKYFNNSTFYGYKKINKELTKEAKELQDYHKFIENIIIEYMKESRSVYSYTKSKNIYDCVALHKDSKFYFKTDIKSFFQSIDIELIKNIIKDNIINIKVHDLDKYVDAIVQIVTYNRVLPVGFTTSPKLSNKILYEFDILLKEYCDMNTILYSRYSDDLIFSSDDYSVLQDIQNKIEEIFQEKYNNKFRLNKNKTKFLNKSKKISLLGMIITPQGHITVEKFIKEDMKQLLYLYKTDKQKYQEFLDKKYHGSQAKAYGKLNYIYEIDKSYVLYLRKKYGNYIIDTFLHGEKHG